MNLGLQNKWVVITGASRGLGKIIAQHYLEDGASVCLVARGEEQLHCTAQEFAVHFSADCIKVIAADLATDEGIQHLLEFAQHQLPRVDILVANAGSSSGPTHLHLTLNEWRNLLDANLAGPAVVVGAFHPLLKSSKGNVVMISSIAGREAGPAPIPYSAAKLGLAAFVKNASRQLAMDAIRINLVCPGNILLPDGVWARKLKADRTAVESYIVREVPVQRFATGAEIADAVLFLSSERSGFSTGTTLIVDGGQTRSFY